MGLFSSKRSRFEFVTQEPDADDLNELARTISQLDVSLDREKQSRIVEFTEAKKIDRQRLIRGCTAYLCFSALTIVLFPALQHYKINPVIVGIPYPIVATLLAWRWIGYPWIAWRANKRRLKSLNLAMSGADFLSWVRREHPTFVFYLRDFASWKRPHIFSGAVLQTDPLVRELSWQLPSGVCLVDVHDVYEAAEKRANVIHILATDEVWESFVRSACAFAGMIIVALRQSGSSLEKELAWIKDSRTLQSKTLLLYERISDPAVRDMLPFARWNAALWRSWTGENLSGLDMLPGALELVRYVCGSSTSTEASFDLNTQLHSVSGSNHLNPSRS